MGVRRIGILALLVATMLSCRPDTPNAAAPLDLQLDAQLRYLSADSLIREFLTIVKAYNIKPQSMDFVVDMETAAEFGGVKFDTIPPDSLESVHFASGDSYGRVPGVLTFRGNNYRDAPAYGRAAIVEKRFDRNVWTYAVGKLPKMYGEGYWSGCGWTGQPLLVQWPSSTKQIMNMYAAAKAKDDLVEVIYATLDGHIYFLDMDDGSPTRPPIDLGFPFKGAGALDPRGYPMMFLGAGDDSPTAGKGTAHAFIISLIDGKIIYEFGNNDPFSLRRLSYFDSSPLLHAPTDQLIYPGENGILYIIKLNTHYDEATATLSVKPKVKKWRYRSRRNFMMSKVGSIGWWLGIEDSAIIWRHYAIFTDNGGYMFCLDLNTLQLLWVHDVLDDTNCTGVLSIEQRWHPYVYVSTSFHPNWRAYADEQVVIPIWKIDVLTGAVVWQNDAYRCGTIAQPNQVSGGVQGSLAVGRHALDSLVFVPLSMTEQRKGKLVALYKHAGTVAWECDFAAYPWSSPVPVYDTAGNGYIVQCNSGGYLHLIDGRSGEILDKIDLGSNIEASPAVFGSTVVVGTRGGVIYGVDIR